MKKSVAALVLGSYLCCFVAPHAAAQTARSEERGAGYRIAPGDRISITVPQRPDLSREVVVSADGSIGLPLVGLVQVQGMTVAEAEQRIAQALREVYPSVTRVEARVEPSGTFVIYVIGEVGKPGKYAFEQAPTLWDVIREAGGPTGNAAMDIVRVVADVARGGASQVVSVQRALEAGTVDTLPRLQSGDTVIIPKQDVAYTGEGGVDVFGAVVNPGKYRVQEQNTVVQAILLAGGTLEQAKLSKVSVVHRHQAGTTETITVDIRKFLENGDPAANPLLRPGDTVYVPRQNPMFYSLKSDAGIFLGLLSAVVTMVVVVGNQN